MSVMKTITNQSVVAFRNSYTFNQSNTKVEVNGNQVTLKLFGNTIAKKENGELYITNAGWQTATTKERLNGLPNVNIMQKKGTWYLNGQEWDGSWIKVN